MSECHIIIILLLDTIANLFPIPTNVDILLDIRRNGYLPLSIKVWLGQTRRCSVSSCNCKHGIVSSNLEPWRTHRIRIATVIHSPIILSGRNRIINLFTHCSASISETTPRTLARTLPNNINLLLRHSAPLSCSQPSAVVYSEASAIVQVSLWIWQAAGHQYVTSTCTQPSNLLTISGSMVIAMSQKYAPYGLWESPITADAIAEDVCSPNCFRSLGSI
jgi:hypothetical protein